MSRESNVSSEKRHELSMVMAYDSIFPAFSCSGRDDDDDSVLQAGLKY